MSDFRVRLILIQIPLLVFIVSPLVRAGSTSNEAVKFLPDTIASFHANGPATAEIIDGIFKRPVPDVLITVSDTAREYSDDAGSRFWIEVIRTENDSGAYALLTQLRSRADNIQTGVVGVASIAYPNRIVFCKGSILAQIEWLQTTADAQNQLLSISRAFAATLARGDDDVPVLVKHLPNWQTAASHCVYVVTLNGLINIVLTQPVLSALDFEGGTEGVTANYEQSQLLIVEFTTPQFASDNDRRIVTKIQELQSQRQPIPTGYRRVGNYSVFVFNAPDEKTANQLIDQVKYEQVVQWLGDDPHLFERLERYYAETTAGVLVAVLESSGLSLLICLGIGALIGTLLFRHRRVQRATRYSDAGGSVRLNLDDFTSKRDSHRLLGARNPGESNSDKS